MPSKTTCGILLGLLGTLILTALVAAQQSGMSGHMSMETMMQAAGHTVRRRLPPLTR